MKKLLTLSACLMTAALPFAGTHLWSEEAETAPIAAIEREIAPKQNLEISVYHREDVLPLLPLLNSWVAKSFGPFPYLYAPREDQIVSMADLVSLNEKDALVIIAKKGDQVVGVASGAPLDSFYLSNYFNAEMMSEMKEKGYTPSDYFYVCYFLVAPEYRNDLSVVEPIYDVLTGFANKIGKSQLTYFDILHSDNHPLKPEVFSSPEPWGGAITGFSAMDLYSKQTWPTFQTDGTVADQEHTLQFFRKSI